MTALCGGMAPPGAWRSEITGELLSSPEKNGIARVSFTWLPDPAIPANTRGYRVAIRDLDQTGVPYSLSERVGACMGMFTLART